MYSFLLFSEPCFGMIVDAVFPPKPESLTKSSKKHSQKGSIGIGFAAQAENPPRWGLTRHCNPSSKTFSASARPRLPHFQGQSCAIDRADQNHLLISLTSTGVRCSRSALLRNEMLRGVPPLRLKTEEHPDERRKAIKRGLPCSCQFRLGTFSATLSLKTESQLTRREKRP